MKATTSAAVQKLQQAFEALPARAQEAGARATEVLAVLTGTCMAAASGNWDRDLQAGALDLDRSYHFSTGSRSDAGSEVEKVPRDPADPSEGFPGAWPIRPWWSRC